MNVEDRKFAETVDTMNLRSYTKAVQSRNVERQVAQMAFVRHPGVQGKIFVPDRPPGASRKHACKDCFFCQLCSDDRCQSCLSLESEDGRTGCRHHHLLPKQKDSSE